MKILHCCLSCFYIDGFGYQENILPRINHNDGHEVMIVASTEVYRDGTLCYTEPADYMTEYGVRIVRLPYINCIPSVLARKLRIIRGFRKVLYDFSPDVILFHGSCGYEIVTVSKFRASRPNTRLYVDSHEAFYNSAKNWLSKNVLHGIFYRRWFSKALPYIDKVLYIGLQEMYYMRDFMHAPKDMLEYYPLGGEIVSLGKKRVTREEIRAREGIGENVMVFLHTGKLNGAKKTIDLMRAFSSSTNRDCVLLIIGVTDKDIKEDFISCLSADTRIRFLGWKSAEEMKDYICACDIYLQPGSPSATMQTALCCGIPVLIRDTDYYKIYIDAGCCVKITTDNDLEMFFRQIPGKDRIKQMSESAYAFAKNRLDYNRLAKRLYY